MDAAQRAVKRPVVTSPASEDGSASFTMFEEGRLIASTAALWAFLSRKNVTLVTFQCPSPSSRRLSCAYHTMW